MKSQDITPIDPTNNAIIENNTIVNVSNINLAAGSDTERSAVPINSKFKDNLVVNESTHPFKIFDDVSGIEFSNNLTNQPSPSEIAEGFKVERLPLVRNDHGLLVSAKANEMNVGARVDLKPIAKSDTGVSWYPKAGPRVEFNSGEVISVDSAAGLSEAVKTASNGARIELAQGEY